MCYLSPCISYNMQMSMKYSLLFYIIYSKYITNIVVDCKLRYVAYKFRWLAFILESIYCLSLIYPLSITPVLSLCICSKILEIASVSFLISGRLCWFNSRNLSFIGDASVKWMFTTVKISINGPKWDIEKLVIPIVMIVL